MPIFKNILCPIDESIDSKDTLGLAFEIAKLSKAKLIFLYALRLDDIEMDSKNKGIGLREHMKENAAQKLQKLKERFNLDAEIDYEFHSEIGFLASRVLLKFKDQPIDLIILSSELFEELNGRKKVLGCPVLLV
ncbi:MAG: universal stress protein [Bacteroidetes bacterium]|nr:universal stress protein [Bacteroidota bacterium]MDA1119169.1 universal stress protein [Bacteroidota bacterium]